MDILLNAESSSQVLQHTIVFFLALLFGSFFNVVIFRLPKMMLRDWKHQATEILEETKELSDEKISLAFPPSNCPKCGHAIKPWENIPVISYLFLRGKCSSCKTPISLRYPTVEIATAALATVAVYTFGFTWIGLSAVVFSWILLILALIDFDTKFLPDNLTLPLLWLGLICNVWELYTPLENAIWGAVVGYMSLWTVYQLFKLITGKEGMGFGDFKLLAAIGAWLGWKHVLLTILLSSFVGAALGLLMILILGKDKNIPIPFGPYLAIAGWIAMMWGDGIINLYLGTII